MLYDGIVLAAGKNTRLKGIIPSYHKPLLVVQGKPLVVSIVERLLARCDRVVVVASPENCAPIIELLCESNLMGPRVHIVIQPKALGPGEAIIRALALCKSKRVLLTLGDNVIPTKDFDSLIEADKRDYAEVNTSNHISISYFYTSDENEAQRFTRILGNEFIENEPGGGLSGEYRCWTGPLIADTRTFENVLMGLHARSSAQGIETKISPALNYIPDRTVTTVEGSSIDIGTSDALLNLGKES